MLELSEATSCFMRQSWFNKLSQEAMTGDGTTKSSAIADIMNFTDADMNRKINLNE